MKKFASAFILGLSIICLTASCGSDNKETISITNTDELRSGSAQSQGVTQSFENYTLNGQEIKISAANTMTLNMMEGENSAAEDAINIKNSLVSAEKEAGLLEVAFSMSEEPVENGMFVFGIEAPESKDLTLEMYDEEGYEMVANNQFTVNEGNNYKALRVDALPSGAYMFRLKDAQGKELQKNVTVSHN